MISKLANWFDHRTGYRKVMEALLIEHIPGGAKWRYVWGSCLAFVFGIQLVTGVLLMTSYSAGDSTAWGSVYFIQYQMDFGWLIRGLHHFGSQAMVVLLGIHMLQVVIAGAHLPPREVNWWLGLALLGAILGLSLTGYLLPWDQKGYWATQVATNIAGNLPGPGAFIKKVVVGGPEYGHHTLTRFYALHVGILPPLVVVLIIAHLAVFRRHGVTAPSWAYSTDEKGEPVEGKQEGLFWPDQAFRDLLACLVVFGVMLTLVLVGHGHKLDTGAAASEKGLYERWAHAGRDGKGANLDAPADPASSYPPRPEWYFLFLFQLLKYFEGDRILIGTVFIPNGALVLLALLPLLGYGKMRRLGQIIGVVVVVGLLAGAASLTLLALADDTVSPQGRALFEFTALRVVPAAAGTLLLLVGVLGMLKQGGFRRIVAGLGSLALALLAATAGSLIVVAFEREADLTKTTPTTEGCILYKTYKPLIAKIESQIPQSEKEQKKTKDAEGFKDERKKADSAGRRAVQLAFDGIPKEGATYLLRRDPGTQGLALFTQNCGVCHPYANLDKDDKRTAPDLAGFGNEDWILRLLTNPRDEHVFGRTALNQMDEAMEAQFPKSSLTPAEQANLDAEGKKELEAEQKDQKTLARWLASHPRADAKAKDEEWFKAGKTLFDSNCVKCHAYEGKGAKNGPDLTGYGDADWLRAMILAPHRYSKENTMPAFRDLEGPAGAVTKSEWARTKELLLGQVKEPKSDEKRKQIEAATKLMNLSDIDRELIIRFILKDDRVVFGGEQVSGAKK